MEVLRKTTLFKLEQQTKGVPIENVTELHFAALPLLPIEKLVPFQYLRKLSLVSLKPALTSLLAIPFSSLSNLAVLDVSDNKILDLNAQECGSVLAATRPNVSAESDEAASPVGFPAMRRLLLTNNCVCKEESITLLSQLFPELEVLELAENAVVGRVGEAELRSTCFTVHWPRTLVALDSRNAVGDEVDVLDSDEDEESDDDEEDESDSESTSDDEEEEGLSESDSAAHEHHAPGGSQSSEPQLKKARLE